MTESKNKKFSLTLISFNAMSVFSFDCWHGFVASWNPILRQRKIAEIIKKENPDVVTLQEIHTYYVLNLFKKKLNYPYVAYKKYIYGPRGGLVTFSKFPIESIEYENFHKRGSLFNSSFIAHVIKNGVLVCKLKNIPFYVLNVHATPNLDHDDSRNNRFIKYIQAQLTQIAELSKKILKSGNQLIIGGDFNVAKDSVPYHKFIESSGLRDIFARFDSPTQHQEYLPASKKVRRIDYVYSGTSGNPVVVESADHLFTEKILLDNNKKRYLSDHIGLKASLLFEH